MTPSTLVVINGIKAGTALRVSPTITGAINAMTYWTTGSTTHDPVAWAWGNSNPTLSSNLSSNIAALDSLNNNIKTGICGYFGMALGHISTANEMKSSTDFMANVSYSDLGSGITDISSLADQGLTQSLGSIPVAIEILQNAGKVFDVGSMSTFGTSGGLVTSMITNKMANFSGLTAELGHAGVDTTQINDPSFAPQINNALAKITDPTILNSVISQYGLTKTIISLKDLLNIQYYSTNYAQLTGGFLNLSNKLTDLGTTFSTIEDAVTLLNSLSIPSVPNLAIASSTLSTLANSTQASMVNLTGTGTGYSGMPSITDFMSTITANTFIATFTTDSPPTASMVSQLNVQINYVTDLFTKAGVVDFAEPPLMKLSVIAGFAQSLQQYGTDAIASAVITDIANIANSSGDAVISCLAEGKNNQIMVQNGIIPLKFG
jgi:hypothetical protein